MLQIAICDDEVLFTNKIEEMLENIAKEEKIDISADVFFSGHAVLDKIRVGYYYDIIYLDIEMGEENGVEIAREIRKHDTNVLIVFVTSYESFAKEAFEVSAYRFLTKPIDEEKFKRYFNDAKDRIISKPYYFQYKYDKTNFKIPLNEILYFQSEKRVTYIVTKDGEYKKCYKKLNDIEKSFVQQNIIFYRIHQSFYVNPKYVSMYTYDTIVLTDMTTLTISENRRKKINELFCTVKGADIIV